MNILEEFQKRVRLCDKCPHQIGATRCADMCYCHCHVGLTPLPPSMQKGEGVEAYVYHRLQVLGYLEVDR